MTDLLRSVAMVFFYAFVAGAVASVALFGVASIWLTWDNARRCTCTGGRWVTAAEIRTSRLQRERERARRGELVNTSRHICN